MGSVVLRPLLPEEFDAAHGILVSAADWLTAKGIRQWTTAYPKELYRSHHTKGWNYGLESDGQLAAVLTLSYEATTDWIDCVGSERVWWLSKLATVPTHRGKGLGARAVREALGVLATKGAHRAYLDCVHGSGALVAFYEGLGFVALDRRLLKFSADEFDMVLMSSAVSGSTS
ncbi:MAG: GNAT family N-acetyltransferase [Vicinamibacterales bacterium]